MADSEAKVEAKIGVYICSGCDIGDAVETDKLSELADEEFSPAVCKVHESLCAEDAVNMIKGDIASEGLNRVVVCACRSNLAGDICDGGT